MSEGIIPKSHQITSFGWTSRTNDRSWLVQYPRVEIFETWDIRRYQKVSEKLMIYHLFTIKWLCCWYPRFLEEVIYLFFCKVFFFAFLLLCFLPFLLLCLSLYFLRFSRFSAFMLLCLFDFTFYIRQSPVMCFCRSTSCSSASSPPVFTVSK